MSTSDSTTAVAPASPDDFHVGAPAGRTLDQVFRLEETRTVSNDWVVRYAKRHFQVERQSPLPPARRTVQVFENVAGQIEIRYRGRRVCWTEIASTPRLPATARASYAAPPATPRSPGGRRWTILGEPRRSRSATRITSREGATRLAPRPAVNQGDTSIQSIKGTFLFRFDTFGCSP